MTHQAYDAIQCGIGPTEWLIILAVVVLLFGGRKLPELARAMGKSITEFKAGLKGDEGERLSEGRGRREGGGIEEDRK
jgi:sec-independent protein translocase protein TatA